MSDENAGEQRAYAQVLEMLEKEISKAKDCGDHQTAEVFELVRAKVKAYSLRAAIPK